MVVGLARALPRIPCRPTVMRRSVPPGMCGPGQMPCRPRRPTALRIPPGWRTPPARSGPVVPKRPCTPSRCTSRPIPGDFVYADDARVPAPEVFGGGQSPTGFDHYPPRQSALGLVFRMQPHGGVPCDSPTARHRRMSAGAGCSCDWRRWRPRVFRLFGSSSCLPARSLRGRGRDHRGIPVRDASGEDLDCRCPDRPAELALESCPHRGS